MGEQVVDLLVPVVCTIGGRLRQLHVVTRRILRQLGPVGLHLGRIAAHGLGTNRFTPNGPPAVANASSTSAARASTLLLPAARKPKAPTEAAACTSAGVDGPPAMGTARIRTRRSVKVNTHSRYDVTAAGDSAQAEQSGTGGATPSASSRPFPVLLRLVRMCCEHPHEHDSLLLALNVEPDSGTTGELVLTLLMADTIAVHMSELTPESMTAGSSSNGLEVNLSHASTSGSVTLTVFPRHSSFSQRAPNELATPRRRTFFRQLGMRVSRRRSVQPRYRGLTTERQVRFASQVRSPAPP